jgi:hypothetical protein
MASETLVTFDLPVKGPDGRPYAARVCGRDRPDGLYEAWIEFEDTVAPEAPVVRTTRESTQPNHADLVYWASGLTPVYLEGALARAMKPPSPGVPRSEPGPAFEGPADHLPAAADLEAPYPAELDPEVDAILDPFSVYQHGETILRRKLGALATWHLRNIAVAYRLVPDLEADRASKDMLIERIVGGVRAGFAAAAPASSSR